MEGTWRQCTTRRRRYIIVLIIVTNIGCASNRLRNSDFAGDLTPTLGLITHKTTRDLLWDFCQDRLSCTEAVLWSFVWDSVSLVACFKYLTVNSQNGSQLEIPAQRRTSILILSRLFYCSGLSNRLIWNLTKNCRSEQIYYHNLLFYSFPFHDFPFPSISDIKCTRISLLFYLSYVDLPGFTREIKR